MASVAKSVEQDWSISAIREAIPLVEIPQEAKTLAGFRRWAMSPDFPKAGQISFLAGGILVDMSPEELATHNQVKGTICGRLQMLVRDLDLGQVHHDGAMVVNKAADLSTEPDGLFVSWRSLEKGRVHLVPRKNFPAELIEVEGSPDFVLEVVSRSSRKKDKVTLRELYFRAGVYEYLIVDALRPKLEFELLVRGKHAFESVPEVRGWKKSSVFGHALRLTRKKDRVGMWCYTLDVRKSR